MQGANVACRSIHRSTYGGHLLRTCCLARQAKTCFHARPCRATTGMVSCWACAQLLMGCVAHQATPLSEQGDASRATHR